MSFLFPLYLLGALAIAVPILLHLRKRPPKDHVPFSSHLFLEKTPERLTRRTRLDRWLLLALRCLALILLALAFCRPFFRSLSLPGEENSQARAMILIDRSASMQREDLWEQALAAARREISRFDGKDDLALALFDESLDVSANFSRWRTLNAGARLQNLAELDPAPGWLGSELGDAMVESSELLLAEDADRPANQRELIVISDFQEGSSRDLLQSGAWPDEVPVRLLPLAVTEPGNLSLNLAATPARANVEEEEVYRVRIRNAADSDNADATIQWRGFPETAIKTTIAPGTSRILTSAPRPAEALRGIIEVTGDSHPFDNEIYVSPVQARPLRVLLLAEEGLSDEAGSPLFYLRRALQPTPTLEPVVTATETLTEAETQENAIIIATGKWSAETATRLQDFARGGGLVIAIPSADSAPDSLAKLTGKDDWVLSEEEGKDYALLADLDFEHPVLQPFARAQIRDFTKIRFWKQRRLTFNEPDSETRIIATFDGDAPALVEQPIGNGAAFVFLSGWEPKESQLALSSKFVPLLFSIFEHTGFSIRSVATLYVGETEYSKPGFYETPEDETSNLKAVNLVPSESVTEPFDPTAKFPDWGIPLIDPEEEIARESLTATQLARLESVEKEDKQKLWKWIILVVLILLIIESWVAGTSRTGRRSRNPSGTSPASAT
ncbi:MAG: BatA domain-containing protein [Verrucomicrobiales bacterium]|nr:BatA domain-containing protein [Verrucomicrobiales bacterium]